MNDKPVSEDEVRLAREWWGKLSDKIKGKYSIWTILALYAQHVLKTRTVAFDDEKKD